MVARKSLISRLNDNIAASRQQKQKHKELWDKIEDFQTGDHWNVKWHTLIRDNDRVFPSVQSSWMISDQMLARIFDRPLKPVITAEQPVNYPVPEGHPWRQIADQVKSQQLFDVEADSEIAASLMSNILDYEWDAALIHSKLKELVQLGLWYGTGILLDGYDDFELTLGEKTGVFIDTVHPRDFYIDSMATSKSDARWMSYVTLRSMDWIGSRFPDKADEIDEQANAKAKGDQGQSNNTGFEILEQFEVGDRDPNKNKVLETHFIRDFSMVDKEIEEFTGEFEEVLSQVTGLPILDPETGTAAIQEIMDKRSIEIPKFPGGWRKIMKVGNVILNGGESEQELDSPNLKLPIHIYRPWKVPRKFWGMGVVEQTRHLNFLLDKSLKYAVENANRTANNKFVVDETMVEDIDQIYNNERGGIIRMKAGGQLGSAIQQLPAMQLPTAHVQMINLLQGLQDEITGIKDLRFRQDMPKDASGRFIEALEQGANSRITGTREELIQVIKDLSHNIIAQNIDKASDNRIIKITRSFLEQPAYIEFNPNVLSFEDQDFDAKFDVEVPADDLMPPNPIEQNQLLLSTLGQLAQMPPGLAVEATKILNLPNKKSIEKALFKFFQEQAQAQQGQQQMDPNVAKMAADQNEALSQIVRRVGESTSDAIENLAKELGKDRPDLADQLIQSMPNIVSTNVKNTVEQLQQTLSGPAPQQGVQQPVQ